MLACSCPRAPAGGSAVAAEDGPPYLELTAIVRDFRGNHPDFNVTPSDGYGHSMGNIATQLDADGKPVFAGGGYRVSREWRDSENRKISWTLYDADRQDKEGSPGRADDGAITSAESFAQWFRNVPGVNMTMAYTFTATRQGDGMYVYETSDFHPIDGLLNGNGPDKHNFHFTLEMAGTFTYDASANYVFRFKGDDDVWVFIDGKLVVDLGGIAGSAEQSVELNRLGLADGKIYQPVAFHGRATPAAVTFPSDNERAAVDSQAAVDLWHL